VACRVDRDEPGAPLGQLDDEARTAQKRREETMIISGTYEHRRTAKDAVRTITALGLERTLAVSVDRAGQITIAVVCTRRDQGKAEAALTHACASKVHPDIYDLGVFVDVDDVAELYIGAGCRRFREGGNQATKRRKDDAALLA
jgi:hypothetical protein